MDLPKAAELQALVAALAPGLIILGVRQWFVAGPVPSLQDRALSYAALSAVYYAVLNPSAAFAKAKWGVPVWTADALEYVAIPVVLGCALAVATARDWFSKASVWLRIPAVHHVPTAWDYTFSRLASGTFVLATLTDGSQVAGLYGAGSFASSVGGERDLLIAEVWEITDGGEWVRPDTPKSILLCGRDVRTIELMKGTTDDGQEEPRADLHSA